MQTPWKGMDGESQVHLCLYIGICTHGGHMQGDMPVYSHALCTKVAHLNANRALETEEAR